MIYLVTGTPGSGKSLYSVSTLLPELSKQKVKAPDGKIIERRLVVDGIKNLAIRHDLMAPGKVEPDGTLVPDEGDGIWNWPDWCKPGDVIFIDEVQRWWRPRGMGTKPPRDIKMLETHRHFGVDFVLVTQNPMLIDQNVRRLIGRHINVRRLFGGGRAVLYDWDACQADVSRVQNATKKVWNYPKNAYKLYHSSELHTKQKQSFPLVLIVPVLAIVGAIAIGPMAYRTLNGAMTGKGVGLAQVAGAPEQAASAPVPTKNGTTAHAGLSEGYNIEDFKPRVNYRPESAPAYDHLRRVVVMPQVVGGYCEGDVCKCITQQGTDSGLNTWECKAWILNPPFNAYKQETAETRNEMPLPKRTQPAPSIVPSV